MRRRRGGSAAGPSAAPGELELLRSFVNTLDLEAGTDRLGSAKDAGSWLAAHGHRLPRPPDAGELRRLIAFREAIREAAASRGTATEAVALARLDRIAAAHPVRVQLRGGSLPFATTGSRVDRLIERLLGILAAAAIDGRWERLKACPDDRCRWLFYDHSRNRSRTWCSMELCGARSKMRTYRARHRGPVR
jgi:predicted RNA-binding Zn ribbon-like protein